MLVPWGWGTEKEEEKEWKGKEVEKVKDFLNKNQNISGNFFKYDIYDIIKICLDHIQAYKSLMHLQFLEK